MFYVLFSSLNWLQDLQDYSWRSCHFDIMASALLQDYVTMTYPTCTCIVKCSPLLFKWLTLCIDFRCVFVECFYVLCLVHNYTVGVGLSLVNDWCNYCLIFKQWHITPKHDFRIRISISELNFSKWSNMFVWYDSKVLCSRHVLRVSLTT